MQKEQPGVEITTLVTEAEPHILLVHLDMIHGNSVRGQLRWDDTQDGQHLSHWCIVRPQTYNHREL